MINFSWENFVTFKLEIKVMWFVYLSYLHDSAGWRRVLGETSWKKTYSNPSYHVYWTIQLQSKGIQWSQLEKTYPILHDTFYWIPAALLS